MTGKERVITALELGQPDTVPVWELAFNEKSIIKIARHFMDEKQLPEPKFYGEGFFEGKLYYKFYYEKLEFRMPAEEEMEIKIPVLAISLPAPQDEGVVYYSPTEAEKKFKNIPHLKSPPRGLNLFFAEKEKKWEEIQLIENPHIARYIGDEAKKC